MSIGMLSWKRPQLPKILLRPFRAKSHTMPIRGAQLSLRSMTVSPLRSPIFWRSQRMPALTVKFDAARQLSCT